MVSLFAFLKNFKAVIDFLYRPPKPGLGIGLTTMKFH